jgi:elongation factor 1 alpha-like protein
VKRARAGEFVEVGISGLDFANVRAGGVLSSLLAPVCVAYKFVAQVLIMETVVVPIVKGKHLTLHILSTDQPCQLSKLVGLVDTAAEAAAKEGRREGLAAAVAAVGAAGGGCGRDVKAGDVANALLPAMQAKKPRCLVAGALAVVEVRVDRPMCMEQFADFRKLGRIMLRDAGATVGAGIILQILK